MPYVVQICRSDERMLIDSIDTIWKSFVRQAAHVLGCDSDEFFAGEPQFAEASRMPNHVLIFVVQLDSGVNQPSRVSQNSRNDEARAIAQAIAEDLADRLRVNLSVGVQINHVTAGWGEVNSSKRVKLVQGSVRY